jgi:4-amino-4-deoxy-L-arabinose transferase-like glycosyltransferase
VLGLAWYLPIARSLPGAVAYLLDNQAVGRLVGAKWNRHPGWTGALEVYAPTLIAGTLPWSCFWLANARRLARLRFLRSSSEGLLLSLWFALPLLVFAFASSRLPLYLLPLFAPLALVTARALELLRSERPAAWHGRTLALLVAWCLVLLGIKVFAASYPTHRDARRQAAWIAAQGVGTESDLVVVDTALNGLRLYGYPELRWVRAREEAYPLFSPLEALGSVVIPLAAKGRPTAFVVSSSSWVDRVEDELATAGFGCEARVSSFRIALLLCAPARAEAVAGFSGP